MRQRDIFWFWLPLFASWLLMTAEGPVISAAINRLPDEVIMLAAMGIVTSLSVTIESPIINLLATSTANVKDRASYLLVRRFTIHWAAAVTVIAALVAFTPLFDLIVLNALDVPPEIARWVRPGMQIMLFWSAAIAWRRFLQGIMINYNATRQVAWGTVVRLVASGGVVATLALWGRWPGVIIGSLSLMAGVIAEALYATIAARPILRREFSADSPLVANRPVGLPPTIPLTYRELTLFHLPLAGTSLLILLAQPLVTSSLARLDNPIASLAAWPVVFQIMLLARAAAMALPEVIIALSNRPATFIPLRRFSFNLAAVVTLLTALLLFSPLASFYVFAIQDMTPEIGALALSSLGLFLFFPGLATIISWLRGLLINGRSTKTINAGMAINLATTAFILLLGINRHWPGLQTAAIALNLAAAAEILYLGLRTQHILPIHVPLWRTTKQKATITS
jgi:hypothetical protein